MRAKEMIRRLQNVVDKGFNPEVLFDTDAMCFDVHLVGVEKLYFLPDKKYGLGKDYITLHYNSASTPFHINKEPK